MFNHIDILKLVSTYLFCFFALSTNAFAFDTQVDGGFGSNLGLPTGTAVDPVTLNSGDTVYQPVGKSGHSTGKNYEPGIDAETLRRINEGDDLMEMQCENQDIFNIDPELCGGQDVYGGIPVGQRVIGSTGSRRDYDISDIENRFETECREKSNDAQLCCGQPEACLGRAVGADSGTANTALQLLQGFAAATAQNAQAQANAGIASACKKVQNLSYITAGLNLAMSGTCTKNVNSCESSCGGIQAEAQEALNVVKNSKPEPPAYAGDRSGFDLQVYEREVRAYEENLRALNIIIRNTSSQLTECARSRNGATNAAMQAIAAGQAAKIAGLCEQQTNGGLDSIANNDFNLDCSAPGAAANPVCQQQCSRPGAESDPVCAAFLRNINGNNGFNQAFNASPDLGDGSSDLDLGLLLEEDQLADPDFIPPSSTGLASVAGGGGSGLSGGLGAAGGGGDFGGGGGAGGMLDFNSKILRGLSSGQGFSSSAGRVSSGGGFKGYGGGRAPASKGGKKFNLKDFLPGGKGAARRGLAALGGGHPEIGGKTEDIFKRISNRFYAVCLKDKLYDCDTLKKQKPQ